MNYMALPNISKFFYCTIKYMRTRTKARTIKKLENHQHHQNFKIFDSSCQISSRKAQSAVELVMMVSFSLIIFSALYLVILQDNFAAIKEKRNMESQRIAERVGYELDIAASIGNGYSKNFTLPDNILGSTYNVIIDSNLVIINASQTYTSTTVAQNVSGTVQPGDNTIENRDGMVYANQ